MINKPDPYRKRIFEYIEDDLEPEIKKQLESHLKECIDCKKEYSQSKELLDILKSTKFNHHIISKECHNIDIARYAFNEMTGEEEEETRKHISNCDHCLYEVIIMRLTDESVSNEPVYESISEPKVIQFELYNTLKENMQKLKSIQLRLAARAGAIPKHEDVGAKHEVCFLSKEGKISLMSKEICKDELLKVRTVLNGNDFFYSVFHVNKDNRVEELLSTKVEEYPARMIVKDEGFLFLIVLISLERDTIEKINKENVLDYCGKLFDLNDLICIFGKIKRD